MYSFGSNTLKVKNCFADEGHGAAEAGGMLPFFTAAGATIDDKL